MNAMTHGRLLAALLAASLAACAEAPPPELEYEGAAAPAPGKPAALPEGTKADAWDYRNSPTHFGQMNLKVADLPRSGRADSVAWYSERAIPVQAFKATYWPGKKANSQSG